MEQQYYLNRECPKIKTKESDKYLDKNNYLSEFLGKEEQVRNNLGITEIINNLITRINTKVIEQGGIVWDDQPNPEHNEYVLSSSVIYNILENIQNSLKELILTKYNNNNSKISEQQENLDILNTSINTRIKNLEDQMKYFFKNNSNISTLSGQFGDNEYIGINQNAITKAINDIWEKIGEISGEEYPGIKILITPEYFIGEDSCELTVSSNNIFDNLKLYINGELIEEKENIKNLTIPLQIYETIEIKCVAKILGIEYVKTKVIIHYDSFWMGAGTNYSDIMNTNNLIQIGVKNNYNVNFSSGDHLFIIIGENVSFNRADMNGIEIPFIKETVTIDEKTYYVFTSENTYEGGTYNIDLNN